MQEQRPGGLGVVNAVWVGVAGLWVGNVASAPPTPGMRREELHELLGRYVCPPQNVAHCVGVASVLKP